MGAIKENVLMFSAFSKQVRILTLDISFNNRRGLDMSLCALKHDVFHSKSDVVAAGVFALVNKYWWNHIRTSAS